VNSVELRRAIVGFFPTAQTHYGRWVPGENINVLARRPLPTDPLPERFGLYPIAPGQDRCQVGILDFDNHKRDPLSWERVIEIAKPVVHHLKDLGHYPLPFRSTGGRGLHIWLFWDRAQSAKQVRELLIDAVETCGLTVGTKGIALNQVEVFPKADTVPSNSWGRCIDPPLAGQSCALDQETLQPVNDVPIIVTSRNLRSVVSVPTERKRINEWDEAVVKSALAAIPADDYDVWIATLRALRGGAARAGVDARAIAEEWSRTSDKHDRRAFERKWERGFPRERAGEGRSLGTLYWLAKERFNWAPPEPACCVTKIRIQDSEPKLYLITISGYEEKEVAMRSSDLNSKSAFVNRVTEAIDQIVTPPKVHELNQLLSEAERLEADDDATVLGQFRNHLMTYLDDTLHTDKAELRMPYRSWRDPNTERSWFKWQDFEAWLRRQRHYDIKHTEAFHMVRLLQGGKGVVDLERYGKQPAWWVPFNPRERAVEPGAVDVPESARTPF
jgi:hypothetical protein